MTPADIEALAEQAGFPLHYSGKVDLADRQLDALNRFAALVRQEALEEAERIAKRGCLVPPDGGSPTESESQMCADIAAAIRAMKEADRGSS